MSDVLALVIEDHRDIADLFCMVLEEAGFRTEVIRSGDEAVKRLTEVVPDVVTLDLRLPGVPGEDILRQIRADARLAETFVVIITAYGDTARILEGEADMVLVKPVNLNLLRRLVARLYSMENEANNASFSDNAVDE